MTSQATSSDQQWADERAADGAATPMPERRPVGICFKSKGGWELFLANTYLGYYSTAVAAYDAWLLNCADVAVESDEASADAVSAYQRAAAAVVTAIDDKAALRVQRDALAKAAEQAYPALFAARRPAAAVLRRLAARRPVSKLSTRSRASTRS